MHRTLLGLWAALGLWALVIAADPPKPAEPIGVFFSPRAADSEKSVFRNLQRFLDTARTSIHGAVHEIDMIAIAETLAAQANAGLDVQIVVEADWWNNAKNTAARKVLLASKVKVTPDTKKSGLMHNKFFIVDGERVWTGSTNLTETCLLFNYNSSVWVESEALAKHFDAEFADMQAGKFGKRKRVKKDFPTQTVVLGDTKIRVFFSPQDDPLKPIAALIDAAEKSVDVCCFVFSSQDVGEAVLRAHKRGVKVRVLLDNMFSAAGSTKRWPYVPFKEFKTAGIAVKYDDEEAKLHHKFVVVDDKTTLVGSFNLSASAAGTNDENLLIIDSPTVTKQYRHEFDRLWAFFNGVPGDAPPPERGDD